MKIYLDQNILSNLAKGIDPESKRKFVEILKDHNFDIILSFAHVCETAKANSTLRKSICDFVSSISYDYIQPAADIMLHELKVLFESFVLVTKPRNINHFGYILHKTDNAVPFSTLVSNAVSNNLNDVKSMDLFISNRFPNIQSKKAKSGLTKEKDISYERSELIDYLSNEKEFWDLSIQIKLPPQFLSEKKKEFLENLDINSCPVLKLYNMFQTLKYRDRNNRMFNDAIYDTENAVLGAHFCDFLICESNMKEILRQINDCSLIKAKVFDSLFEFLKSNEFKISKFK